MKIEGETKVTGHRGIGTSEQGGHALMRAERDKMPKSAFRGQLKKLRRNIATGWGIFYDPETGETLGGDTSEVVKEMLRKMKESPAKRFKNEIRARAAQIDADAIARDSCYEDNPVKRVKKLRIAIGLYELAEQYELESGDSNAEKDRVNRLISRYKTAVDGELREADADLFMDVVNSSKAGLSANDKERLEEIRGAVFSKETKLYLQAKLKEKRKKMIQYGLESAALLVATGGFVVGGMFAGLALEETFRGIAAITALGVVHRTGKLGYEWIKVKAVLEEMGHRFKDNVEGRAANATAAQLEGVQDLVSAQRS
ncbi:MAG: hypothetical protein KGH64_03670 [Candidatus Micrarchaeota archaeon]|nr:hypothetical protein [Candidatus Micrarchaeota archaeon]